jgi:hypothetical protein
LENWPNTLQVTRPAWHHIQLKMHFWHRLSLAIMRSVARQLLAGSSVLSVRRIPPGEMCPPPSLPPPPAHDLMPAGTRCTRPHGGPPHPPAPPHQEASGMPSPNLPPTEQPPSLVPGLIDLAPPPELAGDLPLIPLAPRCPSPSDPTLMTPDSQSDMDLDSRQPPRDQPVPEARVASSEMVAVAPGPQWVSHPRRSLRLLRVDPYGPSSRIRSYLSLHRAT